MGEQVHWTITEGAVKCLWRPDVAWKNPEGSLKLLEFQSRTQKLQTLWDKVEKMLQKLGILASEGQVVPWE